MMRSESAWFTRRRVVVLAMLLCLAALGAWKWTHRHDARLVGRWLVTEDVPATAEQLEAATDPTRMLPRIEWKVDIDGSGRMSARQQAGSRLRMYGTELHWWTNGDRLRIKWGFTQPGWQPIRESADDLYRVLTGDPPRNPVFNYDCVIEGPDLIRVQSGELPWDQSPKVLYLSRLKDDP